VNQEPNATDSPPRFAARLVGGLALFELVLLLATTGAFGYGFFIDELYFLACSRHLGWGFVDMPPLMPALTALSRWLFGSSLLAVRLLPAFSGAALVLLTGLLARELGGRRFAQGLAALAVITAPVWMVMFSYQSMNAFEQLIWTGCAWIVARILRTGNERLWIVFGVLAGLGLENKHTMVFFGVAIAAAILLTSERRAFGRRWIWLGGLVAFIIFLPNLVWIVQHHFPHLQQLEVIRQEGRNVALSSLEFLGQQALLVNPLSLPLWLGGLGWLLAGREGRRYRLLGIAYLVLILEMLILNGRVYYTAAAYPMLLAAGGVTAERWLAAGRRRAVRPAYAALLVFSGAALAPAFLPCLPPQTFIRYSHLTGINEPRIEHHRMGPLPQLLADRFGWPEMAAEVARIYHTLPAEDRAKAAIFAQNYGQAGAIDLYGPKLGLPPALSGHLTYWYWGPRGYTGKVVIVMDGNREKLEKLFDSVELAGHVSHPYSMPYEHFDIFVCRGLHQSLSELWPKLKKFS